MAVFYVKETSRILVNTESCLQHSHKSGNFRAWKYRYGTSSQRSSRCPDSCFDFHPLNLQSITRNWNSNFSVPSSLWFKEANHDFHRFESFPAWRNRLAAGLQQLNQLFDASRNTHFWPWFWLDFLAGVSLIDFSFPVINENISVAAYNLWPGTAGIYLPIST